MERCLLVWSLLVVHDSEVLNVIWTACALVVAYAANLHFCVGSLGRSPPHVGAAEGRVGLSLIRRHLKSRRVHRLDCSQVQLRLRLKQSDHEIEYDR